MLFFKAPNLQDLDDRSIIDAFSVKQKILHLKFHKYYEFSGKLGMQLSDFSLIVTSEKVRLLVHPCYTRFVVTTYCTW
jgi:hypothetical protein